MGEAAAAIIGNPAEFDLNFRTDRIAPLKGVPLAGQKINTYCAGLLLLCAEQSDEPQSAFFPITETTAAGSTQANLAKLGLSVGTGFVSPTGALFSPKLEIVGRSEPMYDPQRQIEQAIYDHFAQLMQQKDLHPTDDFFQGLRLKVAEYSKSSPLLATALAASANVSAQMDLVSAAKTAAVIETLDDIATGASREFQEAREAIAEGLPPPASGVQPAPNNPSQLTPEQRAAVDKYRGRHSDLAARWDQRQISPPRTARRIVENTTPSKVANNLTIASAPARNNCKGLPKLPLPLGEGRGEGDRELVSSKTPLKPGNKTPWVPCPPLGVGM